MVKALELLAGALKLASYYFFGAAFGMLIGWLTFFAGFKMLILLLEMWAS